MRKFLNYKYIAITVLVIIYICCNLLPPATGIFEDTYYQYSSGGLSLPQGSSGFFKSFNSIEPENTYLGSMNLILRPVSSLFKVIDVRLLGIIYFALLLMFFIIILDTIKFKLEWQNWLFAAFSIFIFGDFAYLLNLNSPNIEPIFLIGVIGLTAISLRQLINKATILNSIIFAVIAFFIGGLKTGYAFLAPVLMLLPLSWFFVRRDFFFRFINISLIAAVSASAVVYFGGGISPEQKRLDLNNAFLEAYEASYKLPPDGISYSYPELLDYYSKNPSSFIKVLKTAANNAYEIRPRYLSNYQDEFKLKEGFTTYSNLKRRIIQADLWFLTALFLGIIIFSAYNMKKEYNMGVKGNYFALIMLCIIAFSSFVAPVIISGQSAISRNLFFYNVFFDIILIYIVIGGIVIASNRREILKAKYGIR